MGNLHAAEGSGSLDASFQADLTATPLQYRMEGATTRLDIGNILRNDSLSSSLNTRFDVEGSGVSWTNFEGEYGGGVRAVGPVYRNDPAHYPGPPFLAIDPSGQYGEAPKSRRLC